MKNHNYFKDNNGKDSSSRLISFIVIMAALIMAEQVLLFAYLMEADIFLASSSAGTTFVSIAGPSMFFLFNQKKQEEEKPKSQ